MHSLISFKQIELSTMNKFLLTAISSAMILAAHAQQGASISAADYARAESMLTYNTEPLVDHGPVRPNWLPGDKFWYRSLTAQGSEFILINPANGKRSAAFDQQKLAIALSAASGKNYTAAMLPFQSISYSADGKAIIFSSAGKQWKYDTQSNQLTADSSKIANAGGGRGGRGFGKNPESLSPDGKKAVFIKDYNLWLRDVATGKQTQLTTDGVKNFGYATDNAGWQSSDAAIVSWSPDSKKIATFKQDERNVGDMYLVTTKVSHPDLHSWKYPLPCDKQTHAITRLNIY